MPFSVFISSRGSAEVARKLEGLKLTPSKVRLLLRAIGTEIAKMAKANVNQQIAAPKEYEERLPGAQTTRTLERLRASIGFELPDASSVRVFANDIIAAQRQFGGPIYARPGSALTLPEAPEAYGHRAMDFLNLILIPMRGFAVLAAIGGRAFRGDTKSGLKGAERLQAGKIDASRFTIMYLLVKSVTTKPHPFWPTIEEAIDRALFVYWNFMQRAQGGANG